MNPVRRSGLTLIEVVIAILLFAVGALGLATTSAALVRQLTGNAQRSRAVHIGATRDEKSHALRCVSASGSESSSGIIADWTVAASRSYATVDQTIQRRDSKGMHIDILKSAAPCD
jgi:prepilin-type N-terminal cleavage/methylation domain-containing protein